jgi:hypothetical protein
MPKFMVKAATSDDEYSTVLSVQHPKKDVKQFNKDWADCSEKVCKIDFTVNPVNTCEEQYRLMGKRGWKIKELSLENPVTLP